MEYQVPDQASPYEIGKKAVFRHWNTAQDCGPVGKRNIQGEFHVALAIYPEAFSRTHYRELQTEQTMVVSLMWGVKDQSLGLLQWTEYQGQDTKGIEVYRERAPQIWIRFPLSLWSNTKLYISRVRIHESWERAISGGGWCAVSQMWILELD